MPEYERLREAVNRLNLDQVRALYVVVESMLGESDPSPDPPVGHRFSFAAAGNGPEDLAERAEEYLRAGAFGEP